MRVYISVDMEGIAGIATIDQIVSGERGYSVAQELMTAETNTAAEGAFDAGASSVLVNDSHGTMDNLLHKDLDPRIRLLFGTPKQSGMTEGISRDHDVAFFLGYHAAAGTPGVLAHTFSPHFLEVRLNGVVASETDVNALQLAAAGVPLGLLTGDNVVCEAPRLRFPETLAIVVKRACGYCAADSLSPLEACRSIREAAAHVIANGEHLQAPEKPASLVVEIDMPHAIAAERGAMIKDVERVGDRTVRSNLERPKDVLGFIMICSQLAADSMRSRLALVRP